MKNPFPGPPTASARDLVNELVVLAKAEALTMLGEQHAGVIGGGVAGTSR